MQQRSPGRLVFQTSTLGLWSMPIGQPLVLDSTTPPTTRNSRVNLKGTLKGLLNAYSNAGHNIVITSGLGPWTRLCMYCAESSGFFREFPFSLSLSQCSNRESWEIQYSASWLWNRPCHCSWFSRLKLHQGKPCNVHFAP